MWRCKCGKRVLDDELLDCPKCYTLKSHMMKTESREKPTYLNYLRLFATINGILAILSGLGFALLAFKEMNRSYGDDKSLAWIIALALALEGLLAYGLLNAIADIAENMIDVGSYVRELKSQNKS